MENTCVIEVTADKKLYGPFEFPADAASFALAELGLTDTDFTLKVVHPPISDHPRPLLRVLGADDAA